MVTHPDKEELRRRACVSLPELLTIKKAELAVMRLSLALMKGDTIETARELFAVDSALASFRADRILAELESQAGRAGDCLLPARRGETLWDADRRRLRLSKARREWLARVKRADEKRENVSP